MKRIKKTKTVIINKIDSKELAEAIVDAHERKEQKDRDTFKNTKLSKKTIIVLAFWGIVCLFFAVGGIVRFINQSFISGCVLFLSAGVTGLTAFANYIMAKTKDRTYILNIASIVLACVAIVVSFISFVYDDSSQIVEILTRIEELLKG